MHVLLLLLTGGMMRVLERAGINSCLTLLCYIHMLGAGSAAASAVRPNAPAADSLPLHQQGQCGAFPSFQIKTLDVYRVLQLVATIALQSW